MTVKEKIAYTRRRVKRPTRTRNIMFRVFPKQADCWLAAAEKAEMSFSAWAAKILDAAAGDA